MKKNVDIMLDVGNFQLHAWFKEGVRPGYVANVSLGSTVIFEFSTTHIEQYSDLEEFANVSLQKFTDRLKALINGGSNA